LDGDTDVDVVKLDDVVAEVVKDEEALPEMLTDVDVE
jgi:hypothetical protein